MEQVPDLFDLLSFSEPREVSTKHGPRLLSKASPEESFWPLWERFQPQYRMLGFSLSKDLVTQKPTVCHWGEVPDSELEKREESLVASRAVSSDFNVPCPKGISYYPFQVVGIEWITKREGSYIGDEMGIGKTIQAIGAINALPEITRVLVITKASLKLNWKRELERWLVRPLSVGIAESQRWPRTDCVILNYDILGKHYNALREKEWDLVVLDECFIAGTPVQTPQGPKPIENIRPGDIVLNAIGCGIVRRTIKRQAFRLVSVLLENGETIRCTPEHPWLTQFGWVKACELNETHYIQTHNEILRILWQTIPGEKRSTSPTFLRHILLSEVESEVTSYKSTNDFSKKRGGNNQGVIVVSLPTSRGWIKNELSYETIKSDEQYGQSDENGQNIKGDEASSSGTWRQRDWADKSRESNHGSFSECFMELCNSNSECSEIKGSECVQGGSGVDLIEVCFGDRWIKPQSIISTGARPQKGVRFAGIRVVSASCIEQTSGRGYGSGSNGNSVYNLEVSGHPSYVIGHSSIVVHNCQAIKNPAAKRTLQILGYTPSKKRQAQGEKIIERLPGKRRVALSGTPIENNVQDLWCVLNYLDPQTWPSYWAFGQRYAGMVKDMGRFIFTGPTNTEELQRRLRSTCMIRRLKRDVLVDLPPITRMIHELDPSGLEQFIRAEQSAYKAQEKGLFDGQVAVELARCGEDDGAFRAAVKNLNQSAFGFDELAKVRAETAFAMVDKVLPVLEDEIEEAGKAIVFGHHRRVLEKLHSSLKGSVLVTGETPIEQRQKAVDRFQTDAGCRYFIGSTRACGEGITLTAASTVYFVEEDWAPSKISQAESRPHRIGQDKNVLVKHFIVPGTINARMINVCIEKQEMIERTLDIDPDSLGESLFLPYAPLATRRELQAEAMLIETREIEEIHHGIKAQTAYMEGMNDIDRRLCEALARMDTITQGQAALGRRLLARYRGVEFPRKEPEPQRELFSAR